MSDRYVKLEDLWMPSEPDHVLNADEIYPGLWMGSAPPVGGTLHDKGFDTLVLCAIEHQVPSAMFSNMRVLYAPNTDHPSVELSTTAQIETATRVAGEVAKRVFQGERVLVTCMAGLNRSGLVTGFALHFLTGWSGEDCIDRIRERRVPEHGTPLGNRQFVKLLMTLPAGEPLK